MSNKTQDAATEPPTYKQSPHHYRLAQRDEILAQIDRALLALKAPPDDAAAPTTKRFLAVLDAPGDGHALLGGGRARQFPPEIFAEYFPEQTPGAHPARFVQPSDATLHSIIEVSAHAVLTPDEIEQLRIAQSKIDDLRNAMSTWSTLKAHEFYLRQQHASISAALDGGAVPPALQHKSLEICQHEFSTQRKVIGELQLKHGLSSFPTVMKCRAAVVQILREKMALLEEQERDASNAFSCPWQPSYLWRACAVFLIRLDIRLLRPPTGDLGGTWEPKELLRGIFTF